MSRPKDILQAQPAVAEPRPGDRDLAYLMCPPDFYAIEYVINPWMEGNQGRSRRARAQEQWVALRQEIAARARVELLAPAPGHPDLVFTANGALVLGDRAILARFRHPERQGEEPLFRSWLEQHGYEPVELPSGIHFEGAGDALLDQAGQRLWLGHGIRTALEAGAFLARAARLEVIPLRLVDPRFYHLDTCFAPLSGGHCLYFPDAFDERSRRLIEEHVPEDKRCAVGAGDALRFACNCVEIGPTLILDQCSAELEQRLGAWGFAVVHTPLEEFQLSGGSARCLVLRLTEAAPAPPAVPAVDFPRRILRLEGHLIDSGLLARAFDLITQNHGVFETLEFRAGQRHEDPSFCHLAVSASGSEVLEPILAQLLQLGARLEDDEARPARLAAVERDGVAPEDFYSTTIYPTDVRVPGAWLRAQQQRMDGVIVVEAGAGTPQARVELLRNLRCGQQVVVGVDGLRIHARPASRAENQEFQFMSAGVSSERRVELAVEAVAWEMVRIRRRAGRIVVVAGPVVVHTGGVPYLVELVRRGFVQALLAGNALAVHDIEHALYGTSLGVDLQRGVPVHGGHCHHLRAINLIRRLGGIAAAVRQGALTSGLMCALVRGSIPFSLAGSIRDDGPLPEVRMDLVQAQEDYARLLAGADMVLMLASMLHAIGVGNMTPAGVKLVCVDINPAVVTKLADRGSTESRPVVTDVGLFLNLLARQLNELDPE